jgi:hypothetical protein
MSSSCRGALTSGPLVRPHALVEEPTVTGILATRARAACCALPLLITARVLTEAVAALLEQTLLALAAVRAAAVLGMWWMHRRRSTRRGAAVGTPGGCNKR